jgi:flagellar capping protein FliD
MLKQTLICIVVCLILLAGCGKEPVEQIAGTKDAMERAKSAEAETYAPQTYKMAADTLKAAMAAKAEADSKFKLLRSYKETERLAARAEVLANEAASQARSEKEHMSLEVTNLMDSARGAIDSAYADLKNAPQGKGTKAEIELMKSDLAAAESAVTDAGADIDAERFAPAKAKLMAAIDKAHGVSREIAAAIARRTQR